MRTDIPALRFVPELQLVYLPIHKNGSSTIGSALAINYETVRVYRSQLDTYVGKYPIVAMWRDPFERIESAWRMYTSTENWNAYMPYRKSVKHFNEWVLMVCFEPCDIHVFPQSRIATHEGKWLPTEIYRWDFDAMGKRVGLVLPRSNETAPKPVEWTDEARMAFESAYDADFEIWRNP